MIVLAPPYPGLPLFEAFIREVPPLFGMHQGYSMIRLEKQREICLDCCEDPQVSLFSISFTMIIQSISFLDFNTSKYYFVEVKYLILLAFILINL